MRVPDNQTQALILAFTSLFMSIRHLDLCRREMTSVENAPCHVTSKSLNPNFKDGEAFANFPEFQMILRICSIGDSGGMRVRWGQTYRVHICVATAACRSNYAQHSRLVSCLNGLSWPIASRRMLLSGFMRAR